MGSESAGADADLKKAPDAKPAVKDARDGTAAASTTPTAATQGLGQRQLQRTSVVGRSGDDAERKADQAADHVMRTPAPVRPGGDTDAPHGAAPGFGTSSQEPVRRAADPAAEQKPPGQPTVKPTNTGAGGGAGPDTATPAGPAPMVAAPAGAGQTPAGAGQRPAESATPAPEPEPPAPAGSAPSRETPVVSPELQDYLDASRGKGAPLPDAVRAEFESRFQRPFDDVRVHDDAEADNAARGIDALAFTRGNDIYFRSGAYDPTSAVGRWLLAHELTHVVQQRPGVNRKVAPGLGGAIIRRADSNASKSASPSHVPVGTKTKVSNELGAIDTDAHTLTFDQIMVPGFKVAGTKSPIVWRKLSEKRQDKQRSIWLTNKDKVLGPASKALQSKIKSLPGMADDKGPYKLQFKGEKSSKFFYFGTVDDIAPLLAIPPWNRSGTFAQWEVDHIHEHQIGGQDVIDNFQLLNRSVNMAAGDEIKKFVSTQVKNFLKQANPELAKPQDERTVRADDWTVSWKLAAASNFPEPAKDKYFELKEMEQIEAMAGLSKLDDEAVDRLEGTQDTLAIYRDKAGGHVSNPKKKDAGKSNISGPATYDYKSVIGFNKLRSVVWKHDGPNHDTTGEVGTISGIAFEDRGLTRPLAQGPISLLGIPNVVPWGGYIDQKSIEAMRSKPPVEVRGASPVAFDTLEADMDLGLSGRGLIPKPSWKILEKASIYVISKDGELGIEATITGGELSLPGPLHVTGGALTLSATTGGLEVSGEVGIRIDKLATGSIGAAAKKGATGTAFALQGSLDFDSKMFEPARIRVSYEQGSWGAEGELGVPPGKVKGIKSARARVGISDEAITADGEFVPAIKGVKKGTLGFKYDEKNGAEITGLIELGEGIPGIKSGKLAATIKEGSDKHSLSGDLALEPSIPGVTGKITGRYEDGAFAVDAQLGYEKGFAKGTVHVGATNQAIGPDGKPAGPPKADGRLAVFGDGTVTLQLTPWLRGTVGLKLTPDGQVEVSGEVALPPTFDVFDVQPIDKELLSLRVDIPIVGVAVAGQRIGIFASIGGAVRVEAGVGPGQLRDTVLKVVYNPAKPEDTTVSGNAKFAVPAFAYLRLSVDGSVGAGIPVVSAKAGLEVFGEIGVFGEASAASTVTWTPTAGVVLDAKGEIFVEPKFKFGINAFVDVSADLWLTTVELYHQTWNLAAFEYGSNLRFGLTLPIHYESSKPFAVSYDQIQWTIPHIEPKELISGLVKQIVG
ncbi:DUF4157 domain-containing protein [Terrabacter sp. Root181]|uniref:eCIS core domain-containing protein n=1 Tax=Terrabacter sp. Root181 TaxID=1736484 RepID=UPI0006FC0AF4|nr:DUF4157 domain-containing protein [Terrabacter sp. Root181]KRB43018.1 hypothetical protein ASD90_21765 [Terrabacter sp. Root181]